MTNSFKKKSINKEDIIETDTGIKVSELITLLEKSSLTEEIFKLLDIDSIKDEFIEIIGAKTIVGIQKSINLRYKKIDLVSSLNDVSLYNEDDFTINFKKIKNNPYLGSLKKRTISTIPIYSASRDFFSGLFKMDKYANKLILNGHKDIVKANLKLLKKTGVKDKKYRILHDLSEDLLYLRGIISLKNYHNYDNNLCVVLGLLTLHNEMKINKVSYSLNRCEYNESFIKMFFESSQITVLDNIGHVKNIIEISNDEIKREAFKFLGVCAIVFENEEKKINEIILSSGEVNLTILSIKHNQVPKTAIQELSNISQVDEIHRSMFNEIKSISKIKNPDQIKFLIKKNIENAKRDEIKKYKIEVQELIIRSKTSNIIQLLSLFKKIELIANEDIEATEYLRFVIYEALVKRK